jgi:hypothetical protein
MLQLQTGQGGDAVAAEMGNGGEEGKGDEREKSKTREREVGEDKRGGWCGRAAGCCLYSEKSNLATNHLDALLICF